jgi:hypothetical protein
VSQPAKVVSLDVRYQGANAGSITVLLYPTIEQRDEAAQTLIDNAGTVFLPPGGQHWTSGDMEILPDPSPFAGERSFSASEQQGEQRNARLFGQPLFVRCGAVVAARAGGTSPAPDALLLEAGRSLDAKLAPLVCR